MISKKEKRKKKEIAEVVIIISDKVKFRAKGIKIQSKKHVKGTKKNNTQ